MPPLTTWRPGLISWSPVGTLLLRYWTRTTPVGAAWVLAVTATHSAEALPAASNARTA